jgi:histidine ammonia-lyase
LLIIDDNAITIDEIVRVAREHEMVELSDTAIRRIAASRVHVDRILESEKPVYGITTGFGELSKIYIGPEDREMLQRNLILSHCTGVGEYLPEDVVRAIILLRIISLSKGYSGIRVETVQKLIEFLNKRICPAIPCKGSVGASGDLSPLSHMAAVLLGEGLVIKGGKVVPSAPALREAGCESVQLAGKEGLALINGTQVMTAIAALVCYDAMNLMKVSDIAAALSLEALRGTRSAFDPRIAMLRPHKGQIDTSINILVLTDNSEIILSHAHCDKVQDA